MHLNNVILGVKLFWRVKKALSSPYCPTPALLKTSPTTNATLLANGVQLLQLPVNSIYRTRFFA